VAPSLLPSGPCAAELMGEGVLTPAADVWSFGVICWEMYRWAAACTAGGAGVGGAAAGASSGWPLQGLWHTLLPRPSCCCCCCLPPPAHPCTVQSALHHWSQPAAACPPFPLPHLPARSGVRAYVGHRMPHIVFLVTSGRGALQLPEGAPKGYQVGRLRGRRWAVSWFRRIPRILLAGSILPVLGAVHACRQGRARAAASLCLPSAAWLACLLTLPRPCPPPPPALLQALMESCFNSDHTKRPR
jgi:hypothetical protein